MRKDGFIEDCKKEERRHEERCRREPNYCLMYLRSWLEFPVAIPNKDFDQMTRAEKRALIESLELALAFGRLGWAIRVAIEELLVHLKAEVKTGLEAALGALDDPVPACFA